MKKVLTAALLMIAIHFFVNHAIADIYKWVDQDGVTHFSDVPPTSEQDVEIIKTPNHPSSSLSPTPAKFQNDVKPTPKKAPQGKIYNKWNTREIIPIR